MFKWTHEHLMTALAGNLCYCRASEKLIIEAICIDSRAIKAQQLFLALNGENFDGHDYVADVVAKGCECVIVEREMQIAEGVNVYVVDSSLRALQQLAHYQRQVLGFKVVAITGSNGKTTTKDLVAAALSVSGQIVKTVGNQNNEIGVPLTLLATDENTRFAVVEMGMRGSGQIAELAKIAEPDVAVVTNVAETHIELLGSIENIAKAKAEIIEHSPRAAIILNDDDILVKNMRDLVKPSQVVISFGNSENADLYCQFAEWQCNGWQTTMVWQQQKRVLPIGLLGRHNIANCQAALAVGLALGLTWEQAVAGLANYKPSSLRLEMRRHGTINYVLDCYNASPLSMRAAFETVRDIKAVKRIAVLGDMLELGDWATVAHEQVVTLAGEEFDYVITYGTQMRKALAAVPLVGGFAAASYTAIADLISWLAGEDDLVLFKGSRGMTLEKTMRIIERKGIS